MISYQSVEIKDEKALFIDDYYKKFAKKVDFGNASCLILGV